MRAGPLDKRIKLLSDSNTSDTVGGDNTTYTEVDEVWAAVLDLRGNQFIAAQQTNSNITTKFRIRYRSDILATWRLEFNGRQYDIVGVPSVIGRNVELEIHAKARDVL